jgi:biopolymer transport protein ExbB/biopolymer transport protein TolQ
MGWFAKGVVIVLAFMSIWSLTITIQKFFQFQRSQSETRKFAPQFSRAIQEENLDQAISLAEKNKKSHVSRVLGEALAEVKPLLRDRATITAADINSAERAVERQMLIVLSEFKRGTGILATVGSTAPFVGLLGTTMGIVNAFTGMAQKGEGLLSNEVDSWMTGVNMNVDGKQVRIIARYSGTAPEYRAWCDRVAADGYRELRLA